LTVGDMGEIFNDMRDERRRLRDKFGVECPQCRVKQPKREPSILLPGQRCKVDGYHDLRPRLDDQQRAGQ
jgi:hypothetical protein